MNEELLILSDIIKGYEQNGFIVSEALEKLANEFAELETVTVREIISKLI